MVTSHIAFYLKHAATIQNEYVEKVRAIDTTTVQTTMLTLSDTGSKHPPNSKSDILQLTAENFEKELKNRALLVMFHKFM